MQHNLASKKNYGGAARTIFSIIYNTRDENVYTITYELLSLHPQECDMGDTQQGCTQWPL